MHYIGTIWLAAHGVRPFTPPWYPLIVVDFLPGVPGWLYNAVLAVCLTFLMFQNTVVVRAEEGLGWVKSTVVSVLTGTASTFWRQASFSAARRSNILCPAGGRRR